MARKPGKITRLGLAGVFVAVAVVAAAIL